MRQRHCCAILTMMGLTETIASSIDEYIDCAIKLGKDLEWREHISCKINNNKHLIYRDITCITALEKFINKIAQKGLSHYKNRS